MAQGVTRIIQVSQSEFVSGVGNSTINFRVTLTETYDEVTRKSNLHFSSLQMLLAGGDRYGTGYLDGQVLLKVGGTTFATVINASSLHGAIHAQMSSADWQTFVDDDASGENWSADVNNIPHNADGSLTVTVEFANLTIANPEGTHFVSVKVSKAVGVELTTIYNPSTLTTSGSNIGQPVSITVTRYNAAYTHSVRAEFLGRTETLITKGTSLSLSWTPAVATYAPLMPNSPSATAALICDTYLDNLLVGSTTLNVVLNLRSADVSPSLSLTIADYDGYKTTYGSFVATKSRLRITAVPTFRYGATQKAVNILANGLSYNSSPVTTQPINASATSVYGSVTDSRGFTGNVENTISILPYSPPQLSYQINRSNSGGTIDPEGAYMRVDYTVVISPLNNINSKSLKVEYKPVGTETYTEQIIPLSAYNETDYAVIAISTEYTYDVRITATDDFESTVQTSRVPSAAVTMDFLAGGNGASFGKVAENEYELDIAESWKLHVRGVVQLDKYKAPSNPNLLDNPFFTVNQRGATSYTVGGYGVDRWKLVSGSATVSGSQITLNGTLRQIRETSLSTNDFTASVKCSSGTATATYNDTTKYFDIVSNGGVLEAAKLEVGEASTLENDMEPDYVTELLKCQRYYYQLPRLGTYATPIGSGFFSSTTNGRISINLPAAMRATPTISATIGLTLRGAGNSFTVTGQSVVGRVASTVIIDCTTSGATANEPCALVAYSASSGTFVEFSADL